MKQRTAVLLSTALTALVILVTLGVASATSLRSQEPTSAQEATDPTTSEFTAVPEIPATATPEPATATPPPTEVATQEVVTQQAGEQSSMAQPELVDYEGTPAYEIKYDGGVMYVDARTGTILYDTRLAAMVTQLEQRAQAEQSRGDTEARSFFESDHDDDHD